MLYELRSHGEYVKLFDPAYASGRATHATASTVACCTAGVRQQLPFQSDRMVGRKLQAGSRLVLALGINKRADQQINYGGTGDVSEESIEDAGAPMRIRWHEGSFIEIPGQIARARAAPSTRLSNRRALPWEADRPRSGEPVRTERGPDTSHVTRLSSVRGASSTPR